MVSLLSPLLQWIFFVKYVFRARTKQKDVVFHCDGKTCVDREMFIIMENIIILSITTPYCSSSRVLLVFFFFLLNSS